MRKALIALFVIIAYLQPCNAADVTGMFRSAGYASPLAGSGDYDADLIASSVELDEDSLPAEAVFLLADPEGARPVVDKIRLIYPSGAPADSMASSMEIWIRASNIAEEPAAEPKEKKFAADKAGDALIHTQGGYAGGYATNSSSLTMAYKGPADENPAEIELARFSAQEIHIRYFSAGGGGRIILPRVEFEGSASVAEVSGYNGQREDVSYPFVMVFNKKPVGSYKLDRKGPGGNKDGYSFNAEQSLKLEFKLPDMAEAVEETLHMSCDIKTNLKIGVEAVDCVSAEMGTRIKGKGRYGEFEMKVTKNSDDDSSSRKTKTMRTTYETDEDAPVASPLIYERVALDGMAAGVERKYKVIDVFEGELIKCVASVMDVYPEREKRAELYVVWAHSTDYEKMNELALVERDGRVLRKYDMRMGIEYKLVADPDEWELDAMKVDFESYLRELKDSLKDVIDMPDNVERARMKIEWKEVPPERLKLESSRQRLLDFEETSPGVFKAEIETIRRPAGAEGLNDYEPLSQKELAAYLLDDDLVETGNEDLRALAAEIVGDEADPYEKARLIFNWIIRNISPFTKETYYPPKAGRIFKDKTGDCKHIAVLFATLARINGIPARFALGQRYIGGSYGYHVWNQIYVDGGWLDVDSSDLGFIPGALHVQLDISPTFSGKGHIGVLLGVRPDPEFEDVESGEPLAQQVTGDVATEYDADHFQDAFFNCRVNFPGGFEHEVIDLGIARKIIFTIPKEPKFHAAVYMFPKRRGKKTDISEIVDGYSSQEAIHMLDLFGALNSIKGQKSGKTQISGREAEFYTGAFRSDGSEFVHYDITELDAGNRYFVFSFIAPSAVFDDNSKKMSFIKKSVEIY